jgi:hypothetical protein
VTCGGMRSQTAAAPRPRPAHWECPGSHSAVQLSAQPGQLHRDGWTGDAVLQQWVGGAFVPIPETW